jgi:hypothetical protein
MLKSEFLVAGGVAQVVGRLPSKCEALSSVPPKKKKKDKKSSVLI